MQSGTKHTGHQCSTQGTYTNFWRKHYQIRLIAAAAFAWIASIILLRQYVPIFNALGMKIQEHPSHQVLLVRLLLIFIVMLLVSSWIFIGWNSVNEWLHRRRWWIGAGVIVSATLLNLNGSSLNIWNAFLSKGQQENTVFGVPRVMRSDEYVVNTLFAFSQQYNDYGWFNHFIGVRASDMYIVKDAPIFSVAEIFRPFHWGYLLFGTERGLAFYWSSRLVVLFLVTYEFFMLLTKSPNNDSAGHRMNSGQGSRGISVLCAILISFSPLAQWWFAVNNLVEMIIDVFGATLLFHLYLSTRKFMLRACYAACILLCAGSFIWTLYPAWQIPMGYVLIALVIWQLAEHWGSVRMTALDWLVLALLCLVWFVAMGYVAYHSKDAINALLNTSYPGNRHSTGGHVQLSTLFDAPSNLALAFTAPGDAPELSYIIDFAPLGFVLSVINLICNKKKRFDVLSMVSLILTIILVIYSVIGFPAIIAKLTGLSMSTSQRATLGIELLNIILFSRSIVCREWKIKCMPAILASIGVAGLGTWLVVAQMQTILEDPAWLIIPLTAVVAFVLYFGVCLVAIGPSIGTGGVASSASTVYVYLQRQYSRHVARLYACIASAIAFCLVFAGVCVNPIQLGANAISKQPIIIAARSIEDSGNPGIWITEGNRSGQLSNLLVANGLTTINALQVTPNQSLWKQLDPSGKLLSRYNRYAFIEFEITGQQLPLEEQITVLHPDVLRLRLDASQLANLGVTYLVSDKDLSQYSNGDHVFTQISVREGGYAVWHLS